MPDTYPCQPPFAASAYHSSSAYHPSVHPCAPEGRRSGEPPRAGLGAADGALEGRGRAAAGVPGWLLSGFGVVRVGRRDQGADEGAQERLPAAPGVVDELEEAEMGGQLLLRDATVRPQPGAQQGPE